MPKNVIYQWRKWCLHPQYAIGVEGASLKSQFAQVKTPIVYISFTDDEMMSNNSIESLHSFYENAPRKALKISPNDIDENRIGHIGCFREKYKKKLWEKYFLPEISSEGTQ